MNALVRLHEAVEKSLKDIERIVDPFKLRTDDSLKLIPPSREERNAAQQQITEHQLTEDEIAELIENARREAESCGREELFERFTQELLDLLSAFYEPYAWAQGFGFIYDQSYHDLKSWVRKTRGMKFWGNSTLEAKDYVTTDDIHSVLKIRDSRISKKTAQNAVTNLPDSGKKRGKNKLYERDAILPSLKEQFPNDDWTQLGRIKTP